MRTSVCLTVFNEEKSIGALLNSFSSQTKKPDEIIVVDGGSTDKTVDIIRHHQKKHKNLRLLVEKCKRARGRNISVELARNKIIAITDCDCVPHEDWLENITHPFNNKEVDIVAGFYRMISNCSFQKAVSVYLGILPADFNIDFLPSTRSMAFRKDTWEKLGGFPEHKTNSAEDTDFNYLAVKSGMNIARTKTALVDWNIPNNIKDFSTKIINYSYWDSKYGTWWHPTKRFSTHNIKVLSVFLRYFLGLFLFLIFMYKLTTYHLLLTTIIVYMFWSFRKVYLKTNDLLAGFWGVIVQIFSDIAVMSGFTSGIIKK